MSAESEKSVSINLDHFRALLLDSVSVGLAMADAKTRRIMLCNEAFAGWFPGSEDGSATIDELFPIYKDQEGELKTEVKIKPKRREIALALEITHGIGANDGALMIQCTNISKIKELEYMIESYSKMIERQNREISRRKRIGLRNFFSTSCPNKSIGNGKNTASPPPNASTKLLF